MQARDLIMGKLGATGAQGAASTTASGSQASKPLSYQPLRSSNHTNPTASSSNYFSQSFTSPGSAKPANQTALDLASKYLNTAPTQPGKLSGYQDYLSPGMTSGANYGNSNPSFSAALGSTANQSGQYLGQQGYQQQQQGYGNQTLPKPSFSPTQLSPGTQATNGPAPAFPAASGLGSQNSSGSSQAQGSDGTQPRVFQPPATAPPRESNTSEDPSAAEKRASESQTTNQQAVQPQPANQTQPTNGGLQTAQDYMNWSAQVNSIDPKYVGELESNIGKVRLENSNLVARLQQIEHRAVAAEQQSTVFQTQIQQLQKDLTDQNQLKSRISQLEFQLEAKTREVTALQEGSIQLRNQLFNQTFDKFDHESTTRECSAIGRYQ